MRRGIRHPQTCRFYVPFHRTIPSSIVHGQLPLTGGIIVYHRSSLRVKPIVLTSPPTTFEALGASVTSAHGPYTVLAIYRLGSVHSKSTFFEEFAATMEQIALYNTQVVILGDLNLQLATPSSSSSATNFQQILEQFGLTQHVSVPTHKGGGWLDVVITRDDCPPTVNVWPPVLSDHGLVVANLPFLHETPVYALRQIREWKHLDRQAFSTSLSSVPAFSDPSSLRDLYTSDLFDIYTRSLTDIIDQLLPVRPAKLRLHPLPVARRRRA